MNVKNNKTPIHHNNTSSTQASLTCPIKPSTHQNVQFHNNLSNHYVMSNNFQQNANIYPYCQINQNSEVMSQYIVNPQPQIAMLQNNTNNFQNNFGGVTYYQNPQDNQIYLLAPIANQAPMNNYLLLSNSHQQQNNFIMPLMKTESLGYVMIKNGNENQNHCLNFANIQNMPNGCLPYQTLQNNCEQGFMRKISEAGNFNFQMNHNHLINDNNEQPFKE